MSVNWLESTIEQRKALYRQLKRAADLIDKNVEILACEITGQRSRGQYIKTLRSGKYSRLHSVQYHKFLAANHPDLIQSLTEDLLSEPSTQPGSQWTQLLEDHATADGFDIVPRGLEIVGLSRNHPAQKIRLNQEFYFELRVARGGFATALQGCRGSWYPLPIHPEDVILSLHAQKLKLPINPATGAVEFLSEPNDLGPHEFVIIVTDNRDLLELFAVFPAGTKIPPVVLDRFAASIEEKSTQHSIFREECLIVRS